MRAERCEHRRGVKRLVLSTSATVISYETAGRRPGDIEVSWADCIRALDELGWQARRSLHEMPADDRNFARHHPDGYDGYDMPTASTGGI